MATAQVQIPQQIHGLDKTHAKDFPIEQCPVFLSKEQVQLCDLLTILKRAIGHEEYDRFLEEVNQKHSYNVTSIELREEVVLKTFEVGKKYLAHINDKMVSSHASRCVKLLINPDEMFQNLYVDLLNQCSNEEDSYQHYYNSALDAAEKGLYYFVDGLLAREKINPEDYGAIFQRAAENGHESIVRRVLTDATAKKIIIDEKSLSNGVVKAAEYGHADVINLVLKSILISQKSYKLSLNVAAEKGRDKVLILLLSNPVATLSDREFMEIYEKAENNCDYYFTIADLMAYARDHSIAISKLKKRIYF